MVYPLPQPHPLLTTRAKGRPTDHDPWTGRQFAVRIGRRVPRSLFGCGEQRLLAEQGPDAVEFGACPRMQPPKAAHAMKALRQHVLKETAKKLEGFVVDLLPGSRATLAKRPT